MFWAVSAVGVALVVAALLAAIATARQRGEAAAPVVVLEPGAFDRLVGHRIGAAPTSLARVEAPTSFAAPQHAPPSSRLPGWAVDPSGSISWGAAFADGAAPAVGVWASWASVDDHVFQAFAHLSHQQVDGIADLLRLVDAKDYAIETAAFARKLMGHVAEWHVQEHLIQAGADVAMPIGSNEPGLDLWADGHAMNVKSVADAGSAASGHFAHYPDIPIIVPHDAAHIPADALHFDPSAGFDSAALAGGDHLVVVDHALSHADMVGQAGHALDVLGDAGPHLHFPWVTAAVSGFREGRLLASGHTDFSRAAKNVAVDTAAVYGGGALGIKSGAVIGTFFGPVGTVVGGIAGGLIGALGGRAAANAVKRGPLDDAKGKFEAALAVYSRREAELVAEAGMAWQTAQQDETAQLRSFAETLHREHDSGLEGLRRRVAALVFLHPSTAQGYLREARSRILAAVAGDEEVLRNRVPRWVFPWAGLVAPREARALAQHRAELKAWDREVAKLLATWTASADDTGACFDLVLAAPNGLEAAERYLRQVDATRRGAIAEAAAQHQGVLSRMMERRRVAVSRLREHWDAIRHSIEAALSPVVVALKDSSNGYRNELRRAGVQVPG